MEQSVVRSLLAAVKITSSSFRFKLSARLVVRLSISATVPHDHKVKIALVLALDMPGTGSSRITMEKTTHITRRLGTLKVILIYIKSTKGHQRPTLSCGLFAPKDGSVSLSRDPLRVCEYKAVLYHTQSSVQAR